LLAFLHLFGGFVDRFLQAGHAIPAFAVAVVKLRADIGQFLPHRGQLLLLGGHFRFVLGQCLLALANYQIGIGLCLLQGRTVLRQRFFFLGKLLVLFLLVLLEADHALAEFLDLLLQCLTGLFHLGACVCRRRRFRRRQWSLENLDRRG